MEANNAFYEAMFRQIDKLNDLDATTKSLHTAMGQMVTKLNTLQSPASIKLEIDPTVKDLLQKILEQLSKPNQPPPCIPGRKGGGGEQCISAEQAWPTRHLRSSKEQFYEL